MAYGVATYRPAEGRPRLAVMHHASGAFYFPKRHGLAAAVALARRLNREA